jgi:hypothetical protein
MLRYEFVTTQVPYTKTYNIQLPYNGYVRNFGDFIQL